MGHMTRIPIEEEYGFRYWIWETLDTFESAQARFEGVVSDPDFSCHHPYDLDLGGVWRKVDSETWHTEVHSTGILGHLHESDDSYVRRVRMEEV